MTDQKPLNELLAQARSAAQDAGDSPTAVLILDLCAAVDTLVSEQEEQRREAFRDGIRGAAKVIRNRQAAPGSALHELTAGADANPDLFAEELTSITDVTPVTINDLRRLRQRINTATEGTDEIDDDVKRIYYSVISERNPTSADILPAGSPSRSLDVATVVIEKVLRNGWWTLGNSGVNAEDKPVGKVGVTATQSSKPQTAATTPLTLLSALVLTLIETSKGN